MNTSFPLNKKRTPGRSRVACTFSVLLLMFAVSFTLSSCGSDSDETDGIVIPPEDAAECVTAEQEAQTRKFIEKNLVEIATLSTFVSDNYQVKVYSTKPTLHVGYNDLYFTVVKKATGNHVKTASFGNFHPLMSMNGGAKKHSTPIGKSFDQVEQMPIYHTWASFLMPTDVASNSVWFMSFNYSIKGHTVEVPDLPFTVEALPQGQAWLKNFKYNDTVYFLTLVNPGKFITGNNVIEAYVSKKAADMTQPFPLADETFSIDIYPTMPDMGNHSSPNNVGLTKQPSGIYQGQLNLSMTGLWYIRLQVKDSSGTVIAGGENYAEGMGMLYWEVTL